jgi:hypothetical protein
LAVLSLVAAQTLDVPEGLLATDIWTNVGVLRRLLDDLGVV